MLLPIVFGNGRFPEKSDNRTSFFPGRLSSNAILTLALGICALSARAQSPAILLGNPHIAPGLQSQGYVITHSVSQTATATSITYSVTPPSNGTQGTQIIGQINLEGVLPVGTSSVPITATANFTGKIEVLGNAVLPIFALGSNQSTSPQQVSGNMIAGKGMATFAIASSTSSPASLTLSFDIGNSSGARLPYLNDFNGDGKSDYTVWRSSDANWYVLDMTDNPTTHFGQPGDVPVAGDYDGDGISDVALWRPSEGNWYIILSGTGQIIVEAWGQSGDMPVPADYDGDGKTDLAIWRPSEGNWYIRSSKTGQGTIQAWGQQGDVPVAGDYDGDGKADLSIWRSSEGNWYTLLSSTGQGTINAWGESGDIPVPGDYDADGIADLAIWRPSTGNWWVRLSSTGQEIMTPWGQSGDIPIPGDYDGDGKNDYAIWRPSDGTWYVLASKAGALSPVPWGTAGDIPIGQPLGVPAQDTNP